MSVLIYAVALTFAIWGVTINDPHSFWFAWCLAWGIADAALVLREVTR